MNLDKLQAALAILNKDGKSGEVNVSHDELHLWPMADAFTPNEVDTLSTLGFTMNDEGGFECFV